MKNSIVIIDYGSGNLRSAAKAFEHVVAEQGLDFEVKVSPHADDVMKASHIVLPGQGAFGDCMDNLQNTEGMIEALESRVVKGGYPFLGICVGMQLLADIGFEHGVHQGLGWVPGEVVALEPDDESLKIPHMGWNDILIPSLGEQDNHHFVLRSTESGTHFYFVHSFMFKCRYHHHTLATTQYGGSVPAVVGRDNIAGVQFHPEKSQQAGQKLISDFLHWRP